MYNYSNLWGNSSNSWNNYGSFGQNYSYNQSYQLGNIFNMFSQILMSSLLGSLSGTTRNTGLLFDPNASFETTRHTGLLFDPDASFETTRHTGLLFDPDASFGNSNSVWNNTSINTSINQTGLNNITNIFNIILNGLPNQIDQTEITVEPKEPEKVFIVGSYKNSYHGDYDYKKDNKGEASDGVEVNLGRTIQDFAGVASGNGARWDYRVHDHDSSNNNELLDVLSKMSAEDKNLTFDNGEAYIISESGEILGVVANNQIGTSTHGTKMGSNIVADSNFQVLEDLGIHDFSSKDDWNANFRKTANAEEATGGKIEYNGQEYDVVSSILRKNTPLILDLNGDGIELTSVEDGVNFDLNGDEKIDQTAWTKNSDDVFLVYDKDGNGEIDSGKELFGDQNGAANGFLELSKYDSNKDGKVDANDDVYSKLQTWSDANHNGKVDEGELKSLIESNVKSLSTGFNKEYDETGKLKEDEYGNTIGLVGSFEKTDGTKGKMIDALLQNIG